MQARLTANNLACRRGDRLLISGLELTVDGGEALHVTGANGVGKSSLLRILAGLLPAYSGDVESIGAIGLLDERPALDPDLSLGRALQFWRDLDGGDLAPHVEAMGLTELLDVPVRYLSTGQRKRAAFAGLLCRSAPIWLLDEPLNGLDGQAVSTVLSQVSDHCAQGGLCVIASHQQVILPNLRMLALEGFAG